MAETKPARLSWRKVAKGKQRIVTFDAKKGATEQPVTEHQLSPSLREIGEAEAEVEIVLDGGKVLAVRAQGEDWTAPAAPAHPAEAAQDGRRGGPRQFGGRGRGGGDQDRGARRGDRGHRNRPERHEDGGASGQDRPEGQFHNPYNFIPAVQPDTDGPLGQRAPLGHDRYHEGHWSGRIGIEIVTETPLLIPDTARAKDENGHKTFDIRTDAEGLPLLPPTSLKGPLRAAYEAVTNSRMGIYQGRDKLAQRMNARDGLSMVPARIGSDGNNVELYLGTTEHFPTRKAGNWSVPGPMYAAWLPRYSRHKDAFLWIEHKERVAIKLQKVQHQGWNRKSRKLENDFEYWLVIGASKPGSLPEGRPRKGYWDGRTDKEGNVQSRHIAQQEFIDADGVACITHRGISTKHDERVFFAHDEERNKKTKPISDAVKKDWENRIRDYQKSNEREIRSRRANKIPLEKYCGHKPGKTSFSRAVAENAIRLGPGDLCYARIDERDDVTGLYPVMISRELAVCAPVALLPTELQPATKGKREGKTKEEKRKAEEENRKHAVRLEHLSPADRVFGWAIQGGDGAWRGQLRIGPITCGTEADRAIERFDGDSLPLAILSTPKPQQARFYVAKDKTGEPQCDGIPKDDSAYKTDKGLRGRKVYPHPAYIKDTGIAERYWDRDKAMEDARPDAKPIPADGRTYYREYRGRPETENGSARTDQNRSIEAWVKPDTTFKTWIDVINLSEAELGALLWLLALNAFENSNGGLFHRLGGGKPLGFGSARIDIAGLDLAKGEGKKKEYETLLPLTKEEKTSDDRFVFAVDANESRDKAQRVVTLFKEAIEAAYAKGFGEVAFIKAFLAAARGFDPDDNLPIHYPRVGPVPDPKGENFRWFTQNESRQDRRLALGSLFGDREKGTAGDPGLPSWGEQQGQGGGGQQRQDGGQRTGRPRERPRRDR